jgi:MFS family permease
MGMGFNSPSMVSLISRLSDRDDQGGVLGISQSLASLARVVGPLWGGFLFDRFGIRAPFVWAATFMMVACAISLAGLRQLDPERLQGLPVARGVQARMDQFRFTYLIEGGFGIELMGTSTTPCTIPSRRG